MRARRDRAEALVSRSEALWHEGKLRVEGVFVRGYVVVGQYMWISSE